MIHWNDSNASMVDKVILKYFLITYSTKFNRLKINVVVFIVLINMNCVHALSK